MSDPYLGEIRIVGFPFAPRGWALCDGQLQAVSQFDAQFSLFGTTYGGDGRTTFGLPDLRGRVPVHVGPGPGLPPTTWGEKRGEERVTITSATLAAHNHNVEANSAPATAKDPTNNVPATAGGSVYRASAPDTVATNPASAPSDGGGGQSHDNVMPFQVVSYIVALFGIYPSRT